MSATHMNRAYAGWIARQYKGGAITRKHWWWTSWHISSMLPGGHSSAGSKRQREILWWNTFNG
ncbi:MAG: hypothetical protein ABIN80_04510 [Dyadobacter sp.]|uniref:hypothetical protein n=1 Tax=Dyadobacter sp. TaxID=1914288 RepID=UPI003262F0DB